MKKNSSKKIIFVLLGLGLILLVGMVLVYDSEWGKVRLSEGDLATETIKAPQSVVFESEIKTKEAKEAVVSKIETIYSKDEEAIKYQQNKVNDFFSALVAVIERDITNEEKVKEASNLFQEGHSEITEQIITADKDKLEETKNEVLSVTTKYLQNNNVSEANRQEAILQMLNIAKLNDGSVVGGLSTELLVENYYPDWSETERLKKEAEEKVPPVFINVSKDEVVIYKGEVVDSADMEKLSALGILSPTYGYQKILGNIFLSVILVIVSFIFIYYYAPPKIGYQKAIIVYGIFILVVIVLAKLIIPIKPIFGYVIPVVSFVVLLSLLLNWQIGMLAASILPVFYGIAADSSFELMVIQFIASLVGLFALRKVYSMKKFITASVYIFFAVLVTSLSFHLIANAMSWEKLAQFVIISFVHALVAIILIYSGLAFLGHVLKITTFLKLQELASPLNPLLRELSLKAPGTYQHSMIVGNLAEEAALQVDADPLFCKVASFYHDVGKLYQPEIFFENNPNEEKLDDQHSLKKSASMIIKHVEEGVDLAKKYNLPEEIIRVIQSHQGTARASYFYNVIEESSKKRVNENDFKYHGPKPKTKEEAIIMLADSAEASMRSRQGSAIKETIGEIVDSRLREGQLNDSQLTLGDLTKIKEAFVKILASMGHSRIDYGREQK